MLIDHFLEGGKFYMSLIYGMWIVNLVFMVKLMIRYKNQKFNPEKLLQQNSWILFFGSLGFLVGIFAQIVGLYHAMRVIEMAGDISPALIAGGLKVTMLAPLYGFGLLLISLIYWFIFRKVVTKIPENRPNASVQ